MKYPTPEEMAELKAGGYDRELLEARFPSARMKQVEDLREQIHAAFAGVTLGNGVGLRQGCAMDDWASEEVCLQRRHEDEKDDWRRISSDDLFHFQSLSYMDAEGFRFHLPAYMLDALKGGSDNPIVGYLTKVGAHGNERIALLSDDQRAAVCAFLEFLRDDPDYYSCRGDIDGALALNCRADGAG